MSKNKATLEDIRNELVALLPDHVYHYWTNSDHSDQYIVYMEQDEAKALYTDTGSRILRVLNGTLDLFTKTEFDPLFSGIEDALIGLGCGIKLNSTQFEEETGYIHYEWFIQFYG